MLRFRDHTALLLAIGLFLSATPATITYVSHAQTKKEADERSSVRNLDSDTVPSSVEPENLETKTAGVAAPDSENRPNGGQASVPKEPARTITIVGRALDERDKGRPYAVITLHEADGTTQTATSDKSGNFRFENITADQQVVLSASAEPDFALDLKLQLKGETRVFWRTPDPASKTKSGK